MKLRTGSVLTFLAAIAMIIPVEIILAGIFIKYLIKTEALLQGNFYLFYIIGILFTNLIITAIFFIIIDRNILKKIQIIEKSAQLIAASSDVHIQLPGIGDNEISGIARSINTLIQTLEQNKKEQIASNQLLLDLNQKLVLNEQALEASLLAEIITNPEGIIISVNNAFTKLYGFQKEEVIGKKPTFLNPGKDIYWDRGINSTRYQELFSGLWGALKDRNNGKWEGTIYNKKNDGEIIPVQLVASAIWSESGQNLGYVSWNIELTKRIQAEESVRIDVYRALSELAEKRDCETGRHLKRIGLVSARLAEALGMSSKFVKDIEIFSPLHDIGKVGIPDNILLAPRKLTDQEMAIMSTHTEIGYSILKDRPTLEMAADIAYCHHEKWDGNGYPRGISGDLIPISSRIVSLIDVYDALRSRRCYKDPWKHETAVQYISSVSGIQFDPILIAVFLEHHNDIASIYESLAD